MRGKLVAGLAVLVMGGMMVMSGLTQGEDAPMKSPPKTLKERLKDPSKPFAFIVHIKTKPGMGRKLEETFAASLKESPKEPGCAAYLLSESADEAGTYVLYEHWKSLEAFETHHKTEYVQELLKKAPELIEKQTAELLLQVGI